MSGIIFLSGFFFVRVSQIIILSLEIEIKLINEMIEGIKYQLNRIETLIVLMNLSKNLVEITKMLKLFNFLRDLNFSQIFCLKK